jgi:ATP-dependent DNA helicase PIF1
MDASITLNAEQQVALDAVKEGKNIFLTGAGGTGKSHTIRAIRTWAQKENKLCAVTAMTGCAALLLGQGAKTLHSWAGIGLARETPQELAAVVMSNRRAKKRWCETQLLILDEISMMTPDILEKLDLIARRVRQNPDIRFGGLQLVVSGDFCQLPPVSKGKEIVFAFESPYWKELIDEIHELHQIERQSEPLFQKILKEARLGELCSESLTILKERRGLQWQENEIVPTLLFARNSDVDTINRANLSSLSGEKRIFEAQNVITEKKIKKGKYVSPSSHEVKKALERLDSDAPYMKELELRIGAQVMLITNMDQDRNLINGSRGVVTGYSAGGLPIVRFLSIPEPVLVDRVSWWLPEHEGIGRSQIPLRVAYAMTIHRSQGASLDSALIDIGSNTFEYGQAYVALSRVRTINGLYIWKFDPSKIRCHPKVLAFYSTIRSSENLSEV